MSYRAEIDGLRAIAIVSVILYHAQIVVFGRDWFEGGFIGVDIFFVRYHAHVATRKMCREGCTNEWQMGSEGSAAEHRVPHRAPTSRR